MTVKAFIVEDEPLARDALRELVSSVDWLEIVGEAADGVTAVEQLEKFRPELVFLDVHLPEMSGLDVLDRLDYDPVVVFTTAYDEYAVAAFELEAIDYLLKPFGEERFRVAIDRARQALERRPEEPDGRRARQALNRADPLTRILARHRGRIVPVELSEVRRLEAQGDYVAVQTGKQKFLVGLSMVDFERRLDSERFIRVHRSHIVNLDYVKSIAPFDGSRLLVEMEDGTEIVASRARSQELRRLVL